MRRREGAVDFFAQTATVKAKANETARFNTAIERSPRTACQKICCEKTLVPMETHAAVNAPVERVTCLTSIGIPKNIPMGLVIPSKNASEIFDANPAIFCRKKSAIFFARRAPTIKIRLQAIPETQTSSQTAPRKRSKPKAARQSTPQTKALNQKAKKIR
jgi:hypothetical protein